jgi:DNA mismatch repair protein MutL
MGNIVLLDDLTINKIAAGEVIERPASVVKEVVENSIDAGADNISIEIKNGGISYIRITDNGKGIAADDLEIAFERHATSKIRKADDLETVKSMGFRGEALASIAAIARVELVTKTEEDVVGHRIIVEGGKIISKEETGCPKGTSITIENLFFNTPVRYKFLKKDFTESGYIEDAITRIALVNPEIAIKFINTGKTIIQTSGNGNMKDIVYGIYGKDIAENIINVDYSFEDMTIKGVIGKPSIARSNRSNQLFFVNKRYVKDKTLTSAAEQAFKENLPFGKYGFLILNLEIDPHQLDVNVHPAKLEVRFQEENKIFKLVYHAIKEALVKIENENNTHNMIEEKQMKNDYAEEIQKIENKMFEDINEDDTNKAKTTELKGLGSFFKSILGGSKNEFSTNEGNVVEQLYRDKMQHKYDDVFSNNSDDENKNKNQNQNVNIVSSINIEKTETNEVNEKDAKDFAETNTLEIKPSSNLERLVKELDENLEKLNMKPVSSGLGVFNTEEKSSEANQTNNVNVEENEGINDIINGAVLEDDLSASLENYRALESLNAEENSKVDSSVKEKQSYEINENNSDDAKTKESDIAFEEMYAKMFGTVIPNRNKAVEEEDRGYAVKQEDFKTVENVSLFSDNAIYTRPIYKYIGIVFDTYIAIEYEKELYIIDQRSANERILYEKIKNNYYSETDKDAQLMLLPDIINLSEKEMDIAKENMEIFRKAGFELDEFGDKTIKLSGVPNICLDLDTKQLFIEILEEINTVARTARQEIEEKFLTTIACKAALKVEYALTAQEVDELLQKLLVLPHPFASPNGTPTAIRMSKIDIEKKFSRR